jgi:hypothetical protein
VDEDAVRVMAGDGDGPLNRPPSRGWAFLAVFVAVASLAVLWTVASRGTTATDRAPIATIPTATPPIGSSAVVSTVPLTAAASPTTSLTRPTIAPLVTTDITVELLKGASALEGDVALAPQPAAIGGDQIWVFRAGGSVVHRTDIPFQPGGYPFPLLMTGGRIAFANLTAGYLIDGSLTDPPKRLMDASFVVPGGTDGVVWFVGTDATGVTWVAEVDVESGTAGERIDVTDMFRWPHTGFSDGLIVFPIDVETYGSSAFWSPTGGLKLLSLTNRSQGGLYTAAGDVAVLVSAADVIFVVDVATGDHLSAFDIDLGEGNVSYVCLSPDQRHVVVVGSTGEAFVGDTSNGEITLLLSGVHNWKSVGWTSNTQLVYIIDIADETFIQTYNLATAETHNVATLQSIFGWMFTANGSMC